MNTDVFTWFVEGLENLKKHYKDKPLILTFITFIQLVVLGMALFVLVISLLIFLDYVDIVNFSGK